MGYAVKLQGVYVKKRKRGLFGYKVEKANSDPTARVTPIAGCKNEYYRSAYMNFTTGVFDYGDWEDAFFMPRPCLLRSNGTVDRYLNPLNYAVDLDDNPAPIGDESYDGNVMIEFPTIWFSRWQDEYYEYCYVSDRKLDDTYKAYAHYDYTDTLKRYMYLGAYASIKNSNSPLRSLSGQAYSGYNKSLTQIMSAAMANGNGWHIYNWADMNMLYDLMVLICGTFKWHVAIGVGSTSYGYTTGRDDSNTAGLFKGNSALSAGKYIKAFGLEDWAGNIEQWFAGLVFKDGFNIKMTYGTADGSTGVGFNSTGTGYISTGLGQLGNVGGRVTQCNYSSLGRILTAITSGAYFDNDYSINVSTFLNNYPLFFTGNYGSYKNQGIWGPMSMNAYSDSPRSYASARISYR